VITEWTDIMNAFGLPSAVKQMFLLGKSEWWLINSITGHLALLYFTPAFTRSNWCENKLEVFIVLINKPDGLGCEQKDCHLRLNQMDWGESIQPCIPTIKVKQS